MATASDLQSILENGGVPAGSVTTYGDLSEHFYGHRNGAPSIGAMLGACEKEKPDLTHRVVRDDGALAQGRPGGPARQQQQLQREGVPFLPDGRVDLARCRADLATFKTRRRA